MLGCGVLLGLLGDPAPAAAFVWPNTAERVERDLSKDEVALRRRAASRLLDLPVAVARRLTLAALKDTDTEVRLLAAQAALELRPPGAGELVTSWLSDSEQRIRAVACEVLSTAPAKNAIPMLGRVLGDPDAEVRAAAARALGASGDKAAVVPLLGHLDDKHPDVREAVVEALAELGDPRAVAPIIGKIQDSRGPVRVVAARALGRLGDQRAVSALILGLRDSEKEVRVAALDSLGALKARDATQAVIFALTEQPEVRNAAISALAKLGGDPALDALFEQLGGASQGQAAAALGSQGEAAAPRLIQCLEGQPPAMLASGCASALVLARAKGAEPAIVDALRRGVLPPSMGLRALWELQATGALPVVLSFLSHEDSVVRSAAISTASELLVPGVPDGRAVGPIAQALESARERKMERRALVALLGRTGSPRAARWLAPLARESDDAGLKVAAIESLGLLGPAKQDAVLLAALEADNSAVRLAAAIALGRVASAKSTPHLLNLLEQGAEQDRRALALALGGALSRTQDPAWIERSFRALARSRGPERDALLEAVARARAPGVAERLARLGQSGATPDRLKLAEVLAQHPKARGELARLAQDTDAGVRASAVWSLGSTATVSDQALLRKALSDRDVSVAGNAAAALARLSVRTKLNVTADLCHGLGDARSYVRANALAALRLVGERCSAAKERGLVTKDPSDLVRAAAAKLLVNVATTAADHQVLERCRASDPSSQVASACAGELAPKTQGTQPVTVFVVPIGGAGPVPRSPFALVLADGLMRLGLTDRRGAVFEYHAPRGTVELALPAALAQD